MDILKYTIFSILPILTGFILVIFIDYFDKISGRKLYAIKRLKFFVIRSKNKIYHNKVNTISLSAAIMQVVHYTLVLIYFFTAYMIYSLNGLTFSFYLAYGICIYGILLLGGVVFIYIRTLIKESKE